LPEVELATGVSHRNLIVILEGTIAESLEDRADALHPEGLELGGAEGAHAGRAEYMDPLAHRPEDLLVPDGRHPLEISVDEPDDRRAAARRAVDVAFGRRGPVFGVELQARLAGAERRAGEDDDSAHTRAAATSRARAPGT